MPVTNLQTMPGYNKDYKYYGKSGTIVWEGLEEVRANLRSIAEKYPYELGEALRGEADAIMEESVRICPYDQDNPHDDGTPHLNETAFVDGPNFDENATPSVTLSYDTPYALAQHEIQEYHHDIPEQWKYLEHPLNARASVLAANLIKGAQLEKMGEEYQAKSMRAMSKEQYSRQISGMKSARGKRSYKTYTRAIKNIEQQQGGRFV
jgi:hypothetical protein